VLAVPYQRHGEVEHLIDEHAGVRLIDESFTDEVALTLAVRWQDIDEVRSKISGLLNREAESLFDDE
jgi:putative IMPACT (imprinted ancient) family translation regulator